METKVISSGIKYTSLPESYVRPESERPRLSEVSDCQNVPVVDLGFGDRNLVVRQIGDACRDYGFFLVRKLIFSFFQRSFSASDSFSLSPGIFIYG